MSSGDHVTPTLTTKELDELLAEVLANPKIKARLARPYKLDTKHDIALLGSSAIGGGTVYLDRHLSALGCCYGVIVVNRRPLNVVLGLIRHERMEQAIEDELGWSYLPLAHNIAQHWEEQDYKRRKFDPEDVEKAFQPYIKHDEEERIERSPTDLDMRPLLAPPRSDKIIARIFATSQKEKRTHESVGYVAKSSLANQRCDRCRHFIEAKYGGPACEGVRCPIAEEGWCRRYRRGKLGEVNAA